MRMAVIGCGQMGTLHAKKLAAMPDIDLVAVCDTNEVRSERLADEVGCDAEVDYMNLGGEIDAVVVATNPGSHGEICDGFLRNHIHVLVEKPIAMSESDAKHMTGLAEDNRLVLQVGHIERFNPIFRRIVEIIEFPFQIEVHRHSRVEFRQQEVDVVLDLMIHDIDMVLSIARTDVSNITGSGNRDMAIAELKFIDGSVAVLHANRKAATRTRTWCVNDEKHYLMTEEDYLTEELRHFIECVSDGKQPRVGGKEGSAALKVALEISRQIREAE